MGNADPVLEAREKKATGQRLEQWRFEPRLYFCRGCGASIEGTHVPRGWYILTRSTGAISKSHRLGLFCSATCLTNQGPRFVAIEDRLGTDWDAAFPAP